MTSRVITPILIKNKLLKLAPYKDVLEIKLSIDGLIGKSLAIQSLVEKIHKLKDVDSSILILGESGTGKELIAHAIHNTSRRSLEHYGTLNCGSIPESLLESELFGHVKGAFTDAKTSRQGIFEICTKGSLLLDEIGDMPLVLQVKLLRVLQEHELTPVGGSAVIQINTRIIAATHRDILAEVFLKKFREDLYYRLSIITLLVPPLRDRREDIPLLIEYFLNLLNIKFNLNVSLPCPSLLKKMMAYSWPGNIRELQNALERAVVLSNNRLLNEENIFPNSCLMPILPSKIESGIFSLPLSEAKHAFEKDYLIHHLKRCHGQINAMAESSGRYRSDIYRLLSRHEINHSLFLK